MQVVRSFGIFFGGLQHFKNLLFLVVPLYKEAHATVCTIGTGVENMCIGLFPKYSKKGHFLMENGLYVFGKTLSKEKVGRFRQIFGLCW